jgi:hypothetical protein
MNNKRIVVTILVLLTFFSRHATAARILEPQRNKRVIVLKLSDLRSAYLMRAGMVRYDEASSAYDIRAQLQRHFDVVIGLLLVSTPRSIETALARLEATGGRKWSGAERIAWRQKLFEMRYLQLQRLAAYRDRGQFPLNEGQATEAVPIFADLHDTACAVGHLMRLSGWNESVASIRNANNLVYVCDALQSAMALWALTSGLTMEEAALIQPAYTFPAEHDAGNYAVGGLTLERNGLRFENFQLEASNYVISGPYCSIVPEACLSPGGPTPLLSGLGLLIRQGGHGGGFAYPQHAPAGTHFIAIGAERPDFAFPPNDYLRPLEARAGEGQGQRVVIRFDVSTIDPNARINGLSHSSYLYQGGFHDPNNFQNAPDATYQLRTDAREGATEVASLYIDQATVPVGYYQKLDSESFSPRQKLSIESVIWLQDGVALRTYLVDFNVIAVPEPAGAMMVVVGIVAVGLIGPLRRRIVS